MDYKHGCSRLLLYDETSTVAALWKQISLGFPNVSTPFVLFYISMFAQWTKVNIHHGKSHSNKKCIDLIFISLSQSLISGVKIYGIQVFPVLLVSQQLFMFLFIFYLLLFFPLSALLSSKMLLIYVQHYKHNCYVSLVYVQVVGRNKKRGKTTCYVRSLKLKDLILSSSDKALGFTLCFIFYFSASIFTSMFSDISFFPVFFFRFLQITSDLFLNSRVFHVFFKSWFTLLLYRFLYLIKYQYILLSSSFSQVFNVFFNLSLCSLFNVLYTNSVFYVFLDLPLFSDSYTYLL